MVALQNELGVYRDAAAAANLAEHPLVQTLVPNFTASSSRDLDKLVATGFIAGTAASGQGHGDEVDGESEYKGSDNSSEEIKQGEQENDKGERGGGDGESNNTSNTRTRPDSKWSLERKLLRGQVPPPPPPPP